MTRRVGWMLLCVLVCFVSACGGKAPVDGSPLHGLYRSAGGLGFIFNADGTFDTTEHGSGRYTQNGALVVLAVAGHAVNAERLSADELLFPAQDGMPEGHFYRVGSAAADAAGASAPPQPSKATAAPSTPEPLPVDRSKPLDEYTVLDPSDPAAARYLVAAFGSTALTDDQKLSYLSVEGSRTSDVFARKELAAKEMPGIEARLASTREHRYLRVEATDPVYQQRVPKATRGLAFWQPPVPGFGHYDLEKKGFPVGCMDDSSIAFQGTNVWFHPTLVTAGKPCFLSVPDEAVARALEAEIGRGVVPMTVSLFFAVDGPATRIGPHALRATLLHVRLRAYPSSLINEATQPVASFDIDVPQPTM
jgi:hypothetical protein